MSMAVGGGGRFVVSLIIGECSLKGQMVVDSDLDGDIVTVAPVPVYHRPVAAICRDVVAMLVANKACREKTQRRMILVLLF